LPRFPFIRIIVSLFPVPREYENRARVHFIPDLKGGVFVTLRAPDAIKRLKGELLPSNPCPARCHVDLRGS
jgi:hypothetical protein